MTNILSNTNAPRDCHLGIPFHHCHDIALQHLAAILTQPLPPLNGRERERVVTNIGDKTGTTSALRAGVRAAQHRMRY